LASGSDAAAPTTEDEQAWRPFQLAFILLCLEGITDPDSPDRDLTDLLWFPTGGGKTEAYLGLIAFTILLRRLRGPSTGGGVTALMRYTLRLLTIQQFERAASLICALEVLRRSDSERLGQAPISVGLWVGRAATPQKRSAARTALSRLRSGASVPESNPVQLHSCPWCGTPLDHNNYWMPRDSTMMKVSCKNGQGECPFADWNESIPVFLVDEDIYDHRPSLIIATVDKFASLPWLARAADLFNLNSPDESPPELIIQDELHLISGPLGTLAGLYETAIDILCTVEGKRPKVVASTATIRRAGRQSEGLFAREVRQFPPPGHDARDSYFAVEAPPSERGTRMYLGLMAPGTSHTTLMVRTYAALLQGAAELEDDNARDPYWTLVGYFNSLRVLGGARMQVQDDVGDRIELLARRRNTSPRPIDQSIELTSREPSSKIPSYLKQMAMPYPSPEALDVILATNMISVGVDINRLGLMAVMGQPPSTSEYIQSTSRVGRQYPGLVVDLFNSSRSRDRSHYESFVGYHATIYSQVDSTTVTPFSPRARDRAVHAVVVGLARMLFPEFRENDGASAIIEHRALLDSVIQIVSDRVTRVAKDEAEATRRQVEDFIEEWSARAQDQPGIVYSNLSHPELALLRGLEEEGAEAVDSFGTPWSMRDVDQASNLYLGRS
jgi:hypothetical protein